MKFIEMHLWIPMLTLYAIIVASEALVFRFCLKKSYPWVDSLVSFGILLGSRVSEITTGFIIPLYIGGFLWEHRVCDAPSSGWLFYPLFFFSFEFCYYWYHRSLHERRFFWATHSVHHSPVEVTTSTSSRTGWTPLSGLGSIFFLPLVSIGFKAQFVYFVFALHTFIMFWVHTNWIPKLTWIEGILQTPSSHRVHHAINPEYIDKNFGGVLVIYDRLFGTYKPERDDIAIKYGLLDQPPSNNPFKIAFGPWGELGKDLCDAKGIVPRIRILFGRQLPPARASLSVSEKRSAKQSA